PAIAVPVRAEDQVVAVAQGGDASDPIAGVAADQAVRGEDNATHFRVAVAPGHRSPVSVPGRTRDHVVAAAQERDVKAQPREADPALEDGADQIAGVTANEAIGVGDNTADARVPVAPGPNPALAVPVRTRHQVIAVAQDFDIRQQEGSRRTTVGIIGAANEVSGITADEAIGSGKGAARPGAAAAPADGPAIVIPLR